MKKSAKGTDSVADSDLFGKLDPDSDSHQTEKVEALEAILEHWKVQIWG